MNGIEILADRQPWSGHIGLLILQRLPDGACAVGTNVTMERKDAADASGPTVRLSADAAQQLMDELWRCGLRPTEGAGSAGALAAVERHLASAEKNGEHWRALTMQLVDRTRALLDPSR